MDRSTMLESNKDLYVRFYFEARLSVQEMDSIMMSELLSLINMLDVI